VYSEETGSFVGVGMSAHTEYTNRAAQIPNQRLCEQLYELSRRWACGPETCRDPAIYEKNSDISWFSFHTLKRCTVQKAQNLRIHPLYSIILYSSQCDIYVGRSVVLAMFAPSFMNSYESVET